MQKILLFLSVFCAFSVYAADQGVLTRNAKKSFLSAQSFPSTFADVSFADKIAVLTSGYEQWESEYDDNGRCIKNCAYPGITIKDELKTLKQQTDHAVQELQDKGYVPSVPVVVTQNNETVSVPGVVNPIQPNTVALAVPLQEPVMGLPRISSPFGERIHPITGKPDLHKGIDFAVPSGTSVIAPANGKVTNVWFDSSCGNGLKIQHDIGYETVYCHLSKTNVAVGDFVQQGNIIAISGKSGRVTGPHLHYAIKKDGLFINPSKLIGR